MSKATQQSTVESTTTNDETDDRTDFSFPTETTALLDWLDEAPNFVTVSSTATYTTRDRLGTHERECLGEFEMDDLRSLDDRDHVVSVSDGRGFSEKPTIKVETSHERWVHPDYELTGRACHGSQAEVASAWENMEFPSHRTQTIDSVTGAYHYSWSSTGSALASPARMSRRTSAPDTEPTINYHAVNHPEGHGVIEHYSTIAAVRTKTGLVLVNEQDYAGGFARITRPDSWDFEFPLDGVSEILSGHPETLYDIETVTRDEQQIRYVTESDPIGGHDVVTDIEPARQREIEAQLLDLNTGAKVVLLFDSTANNRAERKCGFRLNPDEAKRITTAQDALTMLRPGAVNRARLPILPADEYAADGATYDGDRLGDVTIRQGEWYLRPMGEDYSPHGPIYKALNRARASDWDTSTLPDDEIPDQFNTAFDKVLDDLPKSCPNCGSGGLEIGARTPVFRCSECDRTGCYNKSHYDDIQEDAFDEWLQNTHKERYDEALDRLDSHRPRDLVVDERGQMFVRGTVRHTDNEHQMVNLNDHWHAIHENTRDVTVFDLEADTRGAARIE